LPLLRSPRSRYGRLFGTRPRDQRRVLSLARDPGGANVRQPLHRVVRFILMRGERLSLATCSTRSCRMSPTSGPVFGMRQAAALCEWRLFANRRTLPREWPAKNRTRLQTRRLLLGGQCVCAFSKRRGVQLQARPLHDTTSVESGRGLPHSKTLRCYGAFRFALGFLQRPQMEPVACASSWSAPVLWRFPRRPALAHPHASNTTDSWILQNHAELRRFIETARACQLVRLPSRHAEHDETP
jgi:hypothetical protein